MVDGIHLGYDAGNAYCIYLPTTDEAVVSLDITFAEKIVEDTTS